MRKESEWYLDRFGKDEFRRRQVYALTRTKYSDMYLGVVQMYEFAYGSMLPVETYEWYHGKPPDTTDAMKPYLVTSRDGNTFDLNWLRRDPLIQLGEKGEFDHGVIVTAADWVTL